MREDERASFFRRRMSVVLGQGPVETLLLLCLGPTKLVAVESSFVRDSFFFGTMCRQK